MFVAFVKDVVSLIFFPQPVYPLYLEGLLIWGVNFECLMTIKHLCAAISKLVTMRVCVLLQRDKHC